MGKKSDTAETGVNCSEGAGMESQNETVAGFSQMEPAAGGFELLVSVKFIPLPLTTF